MSETIIVECIIRIVEYMFTLGIVKCPITWIMFLTAKLLKMVEIPLLILPILRFY